MSDAPVTPGAGRRRSPRSETARGRAAGAHPPPTRHPDVSPPPLLRRAAVPSPRLPPSDKDAQPSRRALAPATAGAGPTHGGGGGTPAEGRATAGGAAAVLCPVSNCSVALPSALGDAPGLRHLRRAHAIQDVPAVTAAELGLSGCGWCAAPFRTARPLTGVSSLAAHEARCRANQRRRHRPSAVPASVGAGPATPLPRDRGPDSAPSPAPPPDLFCTARAAWERAPCLSGRCPRDGRWLGARYRLARKNSPLPPPRPLNGMAAVGRRCPGVGTASAGRAPGLAVGPSSPFHIAPLPRPRRNHLVRAIAARRPCRRRLFRRLFVRAGGP